MFYFYNVENTTICTTAPIEGLKCVDTPNKVDKMYFFKDIKGKKRRFEIVNSPDTIFEDEEEICSKLSNSPCEFDIPKVLLDAIDARRLVHANMLFDEFKAFKGEISENKKKVTVVGLGDVGINLIVGLRLLGHDVVKEIAVYSPDENSMKRCEAEINQIYSAFSEERLAPVTIAPKDSIFDCDMLIFTASKGVPPLGTSEKDVRMAQYQSNCEILKDYARMARDINFDGIFAVVSDPVDQLCKYVYHESNCDIYGKFDGKGLYGDQIRGFGLGVMNARAVYYSKTLPSARSYEHKGRAYGPHGEGLIIANDIEAYDDDASLELTELAKKANLAVRDFGYKPFIAPAFSSGALSILSFLRGNWHYSSLLIDGAFFGTKNRRITICDEIEKNPLPKELLSRIKTTHEMLKNFPI